MAHPALARSQSVGFRLHYVTLLSSTGANGSDYMGHVFWDQETWMYPALLLLRPDLAREMLGYRILLLPQAERNARLSGEQGDFAVGRCVLTWRVAGLQRRKATSDSPARKEFRLSPERIHFT